MSYNYVRPELLAIMSEHLLKGSQTLSKELYSFGDKTGKLSRVTILKMWNGVPLDNFSVDELKALFDFLNPKFNIGNADDYFSESSEEKNSRRQDTPSDLNRKQKYLETLSDPAKVKYEESLLRRIGENIEKVFSKDICEMSADELIAGFSNMGYVNKRVVRNELSAIKHYLEWCYNEGYYTPAYAEVQKISADNIEIKKSLWYSIVPTPEKLREIIDVTKDWNGLNTDSVIVCLYWLGLTFDEIYNLLRSDVDLLKGTIKHQHFGDITIPNELVDVFRNYWNNDVVETEKVSLKADETEYFIRRFIPVGKKLTGSRLSPSRMNMLVSEFKKKYEETTGEPLKITGKNLVMSGACWRLYGKEAEGTDLTDEAFRRESRISSDVDLEGFKDVYRQYKEIFFGA